MNYLNKIKDWKAGNTSMVEAIRSALQSNEMTTLGDVLGSAVRSDVITPKDVKSWNAKLNTEQHTLAKEMGMVKGEDYNEIWAIKWLDDEREVDVSLVKLRNKQAKDKDPLLVAVAEFKQSPTVEKASAVNAIMLTMMG